VYAATKAALEALARTYAAETATTNVRVNLFSPGPTRTRMHASGWPGVDPETRPPPEDVAKAMVPLCLPECAESGQIYDYRAGKFLAFQAPA
jgi:NAD(P)-dependent dehydrogenase (short-subunit alcohol dehydrogenase family)